MVAALALVAAGCQTFGVSKSEEESAADGSPADPADAAACDDCEPGCADGEREGFVDLVAEPAIAGCGGGFAVPGLLVDTAPSCDRAAGDDGDNPTGEGCNAADLCASGWHVCTSSDDVAASSADGDCTRIAPEGAGELFFATRQSGPGYQRCGEGSNDVFGCGTVGMAATASCWPLDRESWDLCSTIGDGWICGDDPEREAENASKPAAEGGGVLCCRDAG